MEQNYAKVTIRKGTMAAYNAQLARLAGPGLDATALQVGVHEALVRPHVLVHLKALYPQRTPEQLLCNDAGATSLQWVDATDVHVLYRQRVEQDIDQGAMLPAPDEAGGKAWHLDAVNVGAAWAAVGGPDNIDWKGIRVGQLDTGYTRHHALGHDAGGSWIMSGLCRTIMDSQLPIELAPPAPPDDGVDPMPGAGMFRGHGTRIGATISGWGKVDKDFFFRGVAPKVPHVVVRITDSVAINNRQNEFAEGLRYLVDQASVDVVNVSLGVFPPVAAPVMKQAMAHAHSKGVIVVCAVGNHVDPVLPPALLPEAIAVAGVNWNSVPWSGSSFGDRVDFSAPAAAIYKVVAQRDGVGKEYGGISQGTSYAAAITTGSAALWLLAWGAQIQQKYGRTPARVEAFRRAAIASCRKPPGWQPTPFGAGIIDAGKLCTVQTVGLP